MTTLPRLHCLLIALVVSTSPLAAAGPTDAPASDIVRLEPLRVYGGRTLEETYREQRSLSAMRTDALLLDVPQSITVVSRDLMDDLAMRGMADAVTHVPGATMAQGEGNRDTPVLRGNSSTASFFIDGVRDDVQYFRDLYNIDRVEALKGPNALIFGHGSPGGVINRVTRQPIWASTREITVQAGSEGERRATADIAQTLGANAAFRFAAVYEDSDTYRDFVSIERRGANPTLAWKFGENTLLRVGYEHFEDERVADRGVPSHLGAPLAVSPRQFFGSPDQSVSTANVDAFSGFLEHRLANHTVLRNTTRFTRYEKFYQNVFPRAVSADRTTVALAAYNNATDRDNFFNQTDVILGFATGDVQHELLAGVELGRQETENRRNTGYFTSVGPAATSLSVSLSNPVTALPVTFRPSASDADNRGVFTTAALYVQDRIALHPKLTAIAGARVEWLDMEFRNRRTSALLGREDDLVSPRAGLIYKPADDLALYASYSMTHQPRSGEQLSSLTASNRTLAPEKFLNRELGLKWDVTHLFAVTAAAYRLDRTNVAVVDPADSTRSLLVDGQHATGLELGFAGRLGPRWSLVGGYAYQDGEIERTQSATIRAGARLAQLSRHAASLWARYDFNRTWGAGIGATYRSEFFASADNAVTIPGYTRLDGAVFYTMNSRLRAQVNVENLLDRAYFVSAHNNNNITPGSPRALRVSLTTRF